MSDHLIIATKRLAAQLKDENLRIVDIRGHVVDANGPGSEPKSHYVDYTEKHIPGAVFVDWIVDLCDDADHLRLAEREKFAQTMSRIGVSADTQVVAYDDANGILAARLWWLLNYYGHSRVAVLDGGWHKWVSEGRATTIDVPQYEPKQFQVRPVESLRRQGHEVYQALNSNAVLLDVRTEPEYWGERTLAELSGHIPGAVNLPIHQLTAADNGTLLRPDALLDKFASVGIDGSEPEVIIYSNVGVAACLALLAMHVAGLKNGTIYDTSWQEWGNDAHKPIEQA